MSANDDGGWKTAPPSASNNNGKKNNNNNGKWKNKNGLSNFMSPTNPYEIFAEIDKEKDQFQLLPDDEKNRMIKDLWTQIRKAVIKLVAAPDFVHLIHPIYQAIYPTDRLNPTSSTPTSATNSNMGFSPQGNQQQQSQQQSQQEIIDHILAKFNPIPSPSETTNPPSPASTPNSQSNQSPITPGFDFRPVIISIIKNQYSSSSASPTTTTAQHPAPIDNTIYTFTHSSLGIGSMSKHQSSLMQFAYYLIIITLFPNNNHKDARPPPPLIYDPMFTPLDLYIFNLLGIKLIPNTEGRLPEAEQLIPGPNPQTVITAHISFIPHCPTGISSNVLQSLWGHRQSKPSQEEEPQQQQQTQHQSQSQISNLILISNSFDQVMMKTTIPEHFYHLDLLLAAKGQNDLGQGDSSGKKKKRGNNNNNDKMTQFAPEFISHLPSLYPKITTDPHFYFGLNHYYTYMTQINTNDDATNTPAPPLPALPLLLTKPWLRETPLIFPSQGTMVNDMSVHSFGQLETRLIGNNQSTTKVREDQTESTASDNLQAQTNAAILFEICPALPIYTPPLSTNPELIPASLRAQ